LARQPKKVAGKLASLSGKIPSVSEKPASIAGNTTPLSGIKDPLSEDLAQAAKEIGKSDIKKAALEAWRKLDEAIQKELTAIQEGKELNASTATAIIKYIEASIGLASTPEDLSKKDTEERNKIDYPFLPFQ